MRLKRLVTGVVVSCAAVVVSATPGVAGQTPQAPKQTGKDSMAMCPMMKQMGGMKH